MRYAILSDIHGNWQAWRAVLHDMSVQSVDAILVLGDVVGYGADPADVLSEVHSRAHGMVMGNHEAALAGLIPVDAFSEAARDAIEWTRGHLAARALRVLSRLPLVLTGERFVAVHGSPGEAVFDYVWDEAAADTAFDACTEQLIFCGHTHIPRIFVRREGGRTHAMNPVDFCAEAGKRYIVDVGAVGLSRDGDPRASYCVYDEVRGNVFFRRVAYDVEQFLARVREEGLPEAAVSHLVRPSEMLPSVRERVDFHPPADVAQRVRAAGLRRVSAARRRLATVLVSVAVALAAVAGLSWLVHARYGSSVRWPAEEKSLGAPEVGGRLALPFVRSGSAGGARREPGLRYWSVFAERAGQQDVSVGGDDNEKVPSVVLCSRTAGRVALNSTPVRAVPGARFSLAVSYRSGQPWSGSVRVMLVGVTDEGKEQVLAARELKPAAGVRWRPTSVTMPAKEGGLPSRIRYVQARIEARFTGSVELRDPRLIRRQ